MPLNFIPDPNDDKLKSLNLSQSAIPAPVRPEFVRYTLTQSSVKGLLRPSAAETVRHVVDTMGELLKSEGY